VIQRANYAKGKLDLDRQRRLENLPGWTWDLQAAKWEEGFKRLTGYVEIQGDARVPSSYTIDNYELGSWLITQRAEHSKGTLDVDRQRRLENLPGWTWDSRADRWEEGFKRLTGYVEIHGDARVPRPYTEDGYALGSWVGTQRSEHSKGKLDVERQRRLEDLPGWTWDFRADRWEEGFERLTGYVKRHGDASVPRSYIDDGYKLGEWVKTQRSHHTKGTLDADHQQRLQDLPGWTWDPFADRWEEGFRRLQDYVDHHGDAGVPYSYTLDGYAVGAWVGTQRASHRKGTLDADRQRRLQALPGWKWNASSST
jgi:hypothetical protein